jgi:hypothetical protein
MKSDHEPPYDPRQQDSFTVSNNVTVLMLGVVSVATVGVRRSDSSEGCPGEAFPGFSVLP